MENTAVENKTTIKPEAIPNKAYDLEYGTQYKKEVAYLSSCGFRYTFIKKNEYGVKTYKYKKTPELFRAVAIFYESERNNKEFEKYRKIIADNTPSEFLQEVLSKEV